MKSKILDEIDVPDAWQVLVPEKLRGTVLVIGEADSGKTTLVRYLVGEILMEGENTIAWIDGDPGQSTLGVPTTVNMGWPGERSDSLPPAEATWFIGSTSPRGHMLPLLAGLRRLQEKALERNPVAVIIDTSGLIAREAGGGALKEWELELLRPQTVIGLQRGRELEHLLAPLRHDRRFDVFDLPVSQAVRRHTLTERTTRRRKTFRDYFEPGHILQISLDNLPVYQLEQARPGQLMALLDQHGMTRALAVFRNRTSAMIEVLSPLMDLGGVAAARCGSLALDPSSGEEL